jgi:predicted tellurium resistance membrane protein TerC
MSELITGEALSALFQVIMIDLALAGDNAVVIGLAAAGLQADQRKKAILVGIIASTIRIRRKLFVSEFQLLRPWSQ